jgi:hypothetical protein
MRHSTERAGQALATGCPVPVEAGSVPWHDAGDAPWSPATSHGVRGSVGCIRWTYR